MVLIMVLSDITIGCGMLQSETEVAFNSAPVANRLLHIVWTGDLLFRARREEGRVPNLSRR